MPVTELILALLIVAFVLAGPIIGRHFFGDVGLLVGTLIGVFFPPAAVVFLLKIGR